MKKKDNYNAYMREFQRAKYYKRVAEAKEKLGGKCVKCGTTENLELDHIDPKTKSFAVTRGANKSKEKWDAEVAKCQLLCQSCHSLKSILEKGQQPVKAHNIHGARMHDKYGCRCDICTTASTEKLKAYLKTESGKALRKISKRKSYEKLRLKLGKTLRVKKYT